MYCFVYIFIAICMFIMGTLFGSFFSLATYRIPRKLDIISTRSFCTSCKHKLGFFDLIPVFSYVFCFGKCRYCNDKISVRYFLLELLNGALFVILYLIFGYTLNLLFIILIYAILFVLIGSYIMDRKMNKLEKESIVKKTSNINHKKGVFIAELVVAMILFTILLVSSYITSRNYTDKTFYTIAKKNAVSVAVKNIEIALATDYDKLVSTTSEETISGVKFKTDVNIIKYSDEEILKEDIIKKIEIKVTYTLNGAPYEFLLKTLKGKVI